MNIRPATLNELAALSDLCLRSKAYWGYDDEFLEACREELTLAVEDLTGTTLVVAEDGQRLASVAQLHVETDICQMRKLFIDPHNIGCGYGAALFRWAVNEGRSRGATRMTIEADPGAEPFYQRMGARTIGTAPSGSIPGRRLPLLVYPLSDDGD